MYLQLKHSILRGECISFFLPQAGQVKYLGIIVLSPLLIQEFHHILCIHISHNDHILQLLGVHIPHSFFYLLHLEQITHFDVHRVLIGLVAQHSVSEVIVCAYMLAVLTALGLSNAHCSNPHCSDMVLAIPG